MFKEYNRKYIIVKSLTASNMPKDSDILGEGVCVAHAPSGKLVDTIALKVGDGTTAFSALTWIAENLSTELVAEENIITQIENCFN